MSFKGSFIFKRILQHTSLDDKCQQSFVKLLRLVSKNFPYTSLDSRRVVRELTWIDEERCPKNHFLLRGSFLFVRW